MYSAPSIRFAGVRGAWSLREMWSVSRPSVQSAGRGSSVSDRIDVTPSSGPNRPGSLRRDAPTLRAWSLSPKRRKWAGGEPRPDAPVNRTLSFPYLNPLCGGRDKEEEEEEPVKQSGSMGPYPSHLPPGFLAAGQPGILWGGSYTTSSLPYRPTLSCLSPLNWLMYPLVTLTRAPLAT
jgi:hypothetical protein